MLNVGLRLLADLARRRRTPAPSTPAPPGDWKVTTLEFSWRRVAYRFQGRDHAAGTPGICLLSLVVGVVGGVYGIGGGAIIAPFFVAIYGLPVHTVAGAALLGTFLTSLVGVVFYQLVAPWYGQLAVSPDWLLGALFGLGGLVGMYLGARCQRRCRPAPSSCSWASCSSTWPCATSWAGSSPSRGPRHRLPPRPWPAAPNRREN